jgi:exopolysaccharide biosynthesis polyprenyl glycosylphosphotransferase
MSVGLSYQSWVNTRPARRATRRVPLRTRATARAAMTLVALVDVGLLVVAVAAVGLPMAAWWTWTALAATSSAIVLTGHYHPRITLSVAREAGSLMACAALPFVVLGLAHVHGASTATLMVTAGVMIGALLVSRCLLYSVVRALRARGWFGERTLFIGAGQVSAKLAATVKEHPEYGLRPVGFLDEVDNEDLPLPLFGGVGMLRMVLSEECIDRVVVAFGVTRESDMVDVFRTCQDASVDIHVLPRFFELATAVSSRTIDDLWGYPLLRLRRSLLRRHTRAVKRSFDASVAAIALLLTAPLYAVIAAVVKLSSPGPVHFRQQRVGERGVIVEVLKFRSMRVNPRSDTEWNPADDSITKIGHILRVTGLDELPQLWNILKGDMSLVGPRPERPFFVEQFKSEIPRYDHRHRVPVGLTGLAQVHGLRGDTSIDERARLDNQYIENWSLWRDVVILFQTVSAVVRNTVRPNGQTGHSDTPTLPMPLGEDQSVVDTAASATTEAAAVDESVPIEDETPIEDATSTEQSAPIEEASPIR